MTPRSFELARLSFERLLDNILERNKDYKTVVLAIESIRRRSSFQSDCIAICTETQANTLAQGIVYGYIGDDLDLFPVTAEKKLHRAKARGHKECDIPKDEMTARDCIFVASAIAEGENFTKATMRSVYEWFREIELEPIQARIYSVLFMRQKPISIRSFPQHNLFAVEYRKAIKVLMDKGYVCELPGNMYCVTETVIA